MQDPIFSDNEMLILQKINGARIEGNFRRRVDLYLTDKNLYMQLYSFIPGVKEGDIRRIPLESISTLEGEPQVYVRTEMKIQHYLVVATKDAVYELELNTLGKAEYQRWADSILKCISQLRNDTQSLREYDDVHGSDIVIDVDIAPESVSTGNEISYDVELDTIDNNEYVDIGNQSEEAGKKKQGFFADARTDTKNKEYKTNGYVIKFEKDMFRNSWNAYDNQGNCIYKIKRALVAMRPCLKIYDNRKNQYVAEIKRHINPLPHYGDEFVWVVQGETLGIVTLKFTGKLLDQNYNADFLGWSYTVRPTKASEIMQYNTVIAKPLSTRGANPEPFEYYDLKNELGIVMMFYTNYLDNHEERASLGDRLLNI